MIQIDVVSHCHCIGSGGSPEVHAGSIVADYLHIQSMYVYIYIRIYICIYIYTFIHIYTYVFKYMYMYI